jgi:ribose transport system substrate-binding protein
MFVSVGRTRRGALLAMAAIGCSSLLFLSACSSSSSNSSSSVGNTSSAGADSNAIPAAQQLLRQYETRPTRIGITVPITKPIPSGKKIDFINCGEPACDVLVPEFKQAASVLGWSVNVIDEGLTPQTVLAAWNLAVQQHPDGIVTGAFPKVMFAAPLAKAKAEGIPVVDGYVSDPPGDGLTAVVPDPAATYEAQGKAWAALVLGSEGKKADTVFLGSNTFSALGPVETAFQSEYHSLCPTCQFAEINVLETEVGTTLASHVVAYLHAHPQVNFVVAGEGAFAVGLPQAIQSAGLSAKVVTAYPNATLMQYLQGGQLAGLEMYEQADITWRYVDALARYFARVPVTASETPSAIWVVTQQTASQVTPPYYLVPDTQAQYKKLWGKS